MIIKLHLTPAVHCGPRDYIVVTNDTAEQYVASFDGDVYFEY
jgi:hypothetical protein